MLDKRMDLSKPYFDFQVIMQFVASFTSDKDEVHLVPSKYLDSRSMVNDQTTLSKVPRGV